jgi:hypothetical protein
MAGEEGYQLGGLSIGVDVDASRVASGLATVQGQVAAVAGAIEGEIAVQDRATTSTTAWTAALAKQAAASADAVVKHRAMKDSFDAGSFVRTSTAIANMGTSIQAAGAAAGGGGARGLLLLSQGIEDAQYGISAIINNVPGVLMAFGAGAGLAGAASIALVGISQLTKGMQGLQDVMIGTAMVDPLAGLEKLAKSGPLTTAEQERLDDLKNREKTAAAIRAKESEREKGQQKAFDEATKGISGKDLARGVTAALRAEGVAAKVTPEEQKLLAASKTISKYQKGSIGMRGAAWRGGLLGFGNVQDAARSIEARTDMIDRKNIDNILAEAKGGVGPAGDVAREQLAGLVKRHPKMFPGLTEKDVLGMTPSKIADDKAAKAKAKADAAALEKKADEEARLFKQRHEEGLRGKIERGETFTADDMLAAPDAIRKSYESGLDSRAKAEGAAFKKQHEDALRDKIEAGEGLTADELASAPDSLRDKYFREKIKRGEALSLAERAAAPKAVREAEDEATFKRIGERENLMENGSDLQWRLQNLMNPEKAVKTMGGEQVAASMHGTAGISEEAKRLHEILEVEKKIAENTRKMSTLSLTTRAR